MGNTRIDEEGNFFPEDPHLPMGYDLYDNEEEICQNSNHNES